MQYTRLLGKYASELKYEDLPAEVIEQAKKITLHTIAVAIASMNVPTAQKAVEMVRRKGGTPEATVWGTDLKVPVEEAGFANGTTADTLDWEDCTWTRTSLDALGILTVDAALCLFLRLFLVVSQTHFLKISCSFLWVLLPYRYLL